MDPGNQLRQPWRAPGSASSSSRDGGDSSSSHRGYHGSVHNPAKRVRNGGGLAYRDDETTGYEDDGSEQAAAAAPRWNGNASMGNNSKNRQAMGVLNGLNPLGMKTTNTYASPSTLAAGARAGLVHGSSRTGPSSETYWTVSRLADEHLLARSPRADSGCSADRALLAVHVVSVPTLQRQLPFALNASCPLPLHLGANLKRKSTRHGNLTASSSSRTGRKFHSETRTSRRCASPLKI